jgi:hypothetical protein
MIEELSKDADTFEQLAKDIKEATKPVREKLEVKEAALDAAVEQRLAELKSELNLD